MSIASGINLIKMAFFNKDFLEANAESLLYNTTAERARPAEEDL